MASILILGVHWLIKSFGDVNLDQIVYILANAEGTDTTNIYTFIAGVLTPSLAFAGVSYFSGHLFLKVKKFVLSVWLSRLLKVFVIVLMLFLSSFYAFSYFGWSKIANYFSESTFIEENMVNTKKVNISFPNQKRNLIYIYVESLETSFADRDQGGDQSVSLLQPLMDVDPSAINFSNTALYGGQRQLPGMDYTAAGIIAQTAGLPLKFGGNYTQDQLNGDFSGTQIINMLPGLTSLGEILKQNGYTNYFLMGSIPNFGGRASYLEQHGDYQITGWPQAIQNGWLPDDYAENWGFEDRKLFEFAQNMLTDIAQEDKLFNFSLLTSDTHFPDGYVYGDEEEVSDMQYKNVVFHSSAMVAEFIRWCQEQSWYDNTTIVVTGDHLTMDQGYVKSLDKNYTRTVFNLFLNTGLTTTFDKNRQFSNLDMFPTTLTAIGGKINSQEEQLGLGVNLFSGQKTMIEKYGYSETKKQLEQCSKFYIKEIIEGKKE
ncbi:LTA synthase family protein [Lactococcus raffinolactis]|uniref:LTA synthase family protein n=1 Tax=Pseudolactococcus raffinolactis TaxID=1366 RepID=UPI001436A621|nr:LTA synthase family protein [Lactococcus raffinolactis]QIW50602.1 sulfatase-like hydrolase/transferase [Lactococcus raffinolactis]